MNRERAFFGAVAVVLGTAFVLAAADQWSAGAGGLRRAYAELRALRAREAELQAQRRAAVDEWHDASVRWQTAGEVGEPPSRPEHWTRHSLALQAVQVRMLELTDGLDP